VNEKGEKENKEVRMLICENLRNLKKEKRGRWSNVVIKEMLFMLALNIFSRFYM